MHPLPLRHLPATLRLCTALLAALPCLHPWSGAPAAEAVLVKSTPKLENLNRQIAENAENAQAYSNRGYVLALLGRQEEARADLKKALALKSDARMQNRVGWAYLNLGDYAEARRLFEESAKQSGYQAHYDYYSLALAYWGLGDMPQALANYQEAVTRDPRFGDAKTLRERTLEWTPREQRAIHEVYALWSKTWKPS